MRLSKESPVPLYHQLKEAIREQILQARYRPGERLPSEHEICETYRVSRNTARQAYIELVNEGLIFKDHGRGTFVAEPKIDESATILRSFTDDLLAKRMVPETKLISAQTVPVSSWLAERLHLATGDKAFKIQRLRSVKNEPICFQTTYIPADLCTGLLAEDLAVNSLFRLISTKYGLVISRGEETLEAMAADEVMARYLNLHVGAPVFLVNRLSYLIQGNPVEFVQTHLRGDKFKFTIELHTNGIIKTEGLR